MDADLVCLANFLNPGIKNITLIFQKTIFYQKKRFLIIARSSVNKQIVQMKTVSCDYRKASNLSYRSSLPEMYYKKRSSKKFHKIHTKTTVLESFFKIKHWEAYTIFKMRLQLRRFHMSFAKSCEHLRNLEILLL